MNRNIAELLADYKTLTEQKQGVFYASDEEQIIALTVRGGSVNLHYAIGVALQAGYVIGYRTAQQDIEKKG